MLALLKKAFSTAWTLTCLMRHVFMSSCQVSCLILVPPHLSLCGFQLGVLFLHQQVRNENVMNMYRCWNATNDAKSVKLQQKHGARKQLSGQSASGCMIWVAPAFYYIAANLATHHDSGGKVRKEVCMRPGQDAIV